MWLKKALGKMSLLLLTLSILLPPLGVPLFFFGIKGDRSNWRMYAFILALSMGAFAYCYTPVYNTDLTRYFDFINSLSDLSFIEASNNELYGSNGQGLYIFTTACWIAAKLGDEHIIPALSVFIVYYIGIYVSLRVAEDNNSSTKSVFHFIVFFLLTCNFFAIVNNVRNVLSFSIVFFAAFRDIYQRKRNLLTLSFYILPVFIHPTAVVLILARLFLNIAGKLKYVLILLTVLAHPILGLLYPLVSQGSNSRVLSYIYFVIAKAYHYFYDAGSEWSMAVQQSKSEFLLRLLYVSLTIIIVLLSLILLNHYKRDKLDAHRNAKITILLFCMGMITVACIPMVRPEYWRFAAVVILFSGCIYFPLLNLYDKRINIPQALIYIWSMYPIACFPLWFRNVVISSKFLYSVLSTFKSSPLIILATGIFG